MLCILKGFVLCMDYWNYIPQICFLVPASVYYSSILLVSTCRFCKCKDIGRGQRRCQFCLAIEIIEEDVTSHHYKVTFKNQCVWLHAKGRGEMKFFEVSNC